MTDASTAEIMSPSLLEVAERARREPDGKFHSLAHHLDVSMLMRAYDRARKDAAVGVDGITKEEYGQNLDENILDPDLKARLTPDYSAGCKRLIVSDRFYPAISKPNAELVTDGISRIEPKGIRTSDGRLHEIDVLVLATGFDPHRFLADAERRNAGATHESVSDELRSRLRALGYAD